MNKTTGQHVDIIPILIFLVSPFFFYIGYYPSLLFVLLLLPLSRSSYFLFLPSVIIFLLGRLYNSNALTSGDLLGTFDVYQSLNHGAGVFDHILWSPTEFFTSTLYKYFFPSDLLIDQFALIQLLVLILTLAFALSRFKISGRYLIMTLALLDVEFCIHIYRQSLAMVLLLIAYSYFLERKYWLCIFWFLISFFCHNTMVVFSILLFLGHIVPFRFYRSKYFKFSLLLFSLNSIFSLLNINSAIEFILHLTSGVDILSRADYALNFIDTSGDLRILFYVSLFFGIFFDEENYLMKIFYFFALIYLITGNVPILGPRISILSSSIIVGLPISLMARRLYLFFPRLFFTIAA